MQPNRRDVLKHMGWLTAAGAGALGAGDLMASEGAVGPKDPMGVLVDLTVCNGCRTCEYACRKANGIEAGALETYDDPTVFKERRRPAIDAFTVVNSWPGKAEGKPVFAKVNCFHCNHPACASACIVGALRKQDNGAVTYEAWKCIGCRYCMVACPFQIPAYEYDDALTPRVRKCEFCTPRTAEGQRPACVEACPRQVMTYGKRRELIALAHEKIAAHPDIYLDRIYGEHEVGGTSWLYLAGVPFEQAGFLKLPEAAPPVITEAIQHGVFKMGIWPATLYGLLGATMWLTGRRRAGHATAHTEVHAHAPVHAAAPVAVLAGTTGEPEITDTTVAPEHWTPRPDGAHSIHNPRHESGEHHEEPLPVRRKLFTPGVFILLGLMAAGLVAGLARFVLGLGATTNLDQQYPWGLWIGVDVASGVALAAGGFTSAFLTHILRRDRYHAIARPALLTAMLGYTFVVIGLQADLGRYYNVWHPMIMWQGNSVLFEVGMCVMCYLNVLYLEFAPLACHFFTSRREKFPRLARLASLAECKIEKIMFALVIAGCCLSCLHQSSLGNLLVIAPSKVHPLWWSPLSPLMFLMSAIAVGFPMVIWESLFAGWSLKLKPEMNVLGPLARFIPWTLGAYLAVKIGDVIYRGAYVYLGDGSVQSICWLAEVTVGVVVPLAMLLMPSVRRRPGALFAAVTLVVGGVLFNRVNVFLVAYKPPFTSKTYWPSAAEWAVTVGLFAALMFIYRVIVTYLPVISQPKGQEQAA